jgi:hypothetical protein
MTPAKVRIEQRLKNEFEKDPTAAMFRAQQVKNEEENKDRATSYVRLLVHTGRTAIGFDRFIGFAG